MSQKHSEQYKIIGQAIKKYRKQRGLTQEQLAELNWNPSFQFASLSSDLANRLHK